MPSLPGFRPPYLPIVALAMLIGTPHDACAQATTVVVERHAEKSNDDPADPLLSTDGQARAMDLAAAVAEMGVDAVFTTQYRRTQLTAAPTAAAHKIDVVAVPIDALNAGTYADDLVERIRRLPSGRSTLIVGHSNTVPAIVHALSGYDIGELSEDAYDRLYVITLSHDDADVPLLLQVRYSAP